MTDKRDMRKNRIGAVMGMTPTSDLARRVAELVRGEVSIPAIANLVGVPKGILRRWLNPDDDAPQSHLDFAKVVQEARQQVTRSKEELQKVALHVIEDTMVDDKNPQRTRVAQWYLERTDPEFNPVAKQEVTGKDGTPLIPTPKSLTREEILKELAAIEARKGSSV